MAQSDEEDDPLWVDLESLDEMELRIIAEKVMELLGRDLRFERERRGWDEQWGGWRQG